MKAYITPAITVFNAAPGQIMAVSQIGFDSTSTTNDNFIREERDPWSDSMGEDW